MHLLCVTHACIMALAINGPERIGNAEHPGCSCIWSPVSVRPFVLVQLLSVRAAMPHLLQPQAGTPVNGLISLRCWRPPAVLHSRAHRAKLQ